MGIERAQLKVTHELAGRVDRVVQSITGRSRAEVRGLFDHGCVWLNGAHCDEPGAPVREGDEVAVRHDPQQRYREAPRTRDSAAFGLVFEDDCLIVVDKNAAMLTVPTPRGESNTLLEAVSRHIRRHRRNGRAEVVHRLDRGTSGLLVFAKDSQVAGALHDQFRAHQAAREYAAIVAGTVAEPEGTFDSRLRTTKSLQRYSARPGEAGERAVTHYRVVDRLRGATHVRVSLETGRRNQIRVHFSECGHPVLGDKRYRAELAAHPAWKARRLALHAAVLGFVHPGTGQALRFESPLPAEFERFLARQRTGAQRR